tara:strand:+ start:4359 stop:4847 length:489 start_codon:yes stop_codon:yes gene_type:complete
MFLSINHKKFDPYNIIISEKRKNNVMPGSDFHRLIFSDEFCSINGVFLHFTLTEINIDKYFNKIKCIFNNSHSNCNVIQTIKNIEKTILNKFQSNNNNNKIPSYRIYEQLQHSFIKLYGDDRIKYGKCAEVKFLLKISGIWASNQTNEVGLTFRFFIFNNLF